jgi:hypothetical protein
MSESATSSKPPTPPESQLPTDIDQVNLRIRQLKLARLQREQDVLKTFDARAAAFDERQRADPAPPPAEFPLFWVFIALAAFLIMSRW